VRRRRSKWRRSKWRKRMSKNAGLVHLSLGLPNMKSAAQYLKLHASNPQHINRMGR